MMSKTPPRQLLNPLKGDNPQFNATTGSCESTVEGGGNPCTYISLKQQAPAYSKYASSILAGSQEYQALVSFATIANISHRNRILFH
jgi:hypothetical protein